MRDCKKETDRLSDLHGDPAVTSFAVLQGLELAIIQPQQKEGLPLFGFFSKSKIHNNTASQALKDCTSLCTSRGFDLNHGCTLIVFLLLQIYEKQQEFVQNICLG